MIKNYEITNRDLLGSNSFIRLFKASVILAILLRNYLLKLILFMLSYAVPKNKRLLFFSSVGNYNFPLWANEEDYQFKESPKHLAIYSAKKLKSFITVFHVPNKKLFKKIEDLGIKPTKGLRAFWYMLRARYLFVDNNNFFNPNASFLVGRFKIVQCWHGTHHGAAFIKNIRGDKKQRPGLVDRIKNIEKRKFAFVISSCSHATQDFKKRFCTEKILEIGYPKNDILFHPDFFSCENLNSKLSLSNYEKVFLYAPTYRRIGRAAEPFDRQFLSKLNEWLKDKNYIFLIKQHPYARSVSELVEFSNISDVSCLIEDIQELLVHADVLISDYSSIIFDFVLTDRTVVLYPYDAAECGCDKELDRDYYQRMPGPFANTQEELFDLMKSIAIWSSDKKYIERYNRFKEKFNHYKDGKSCERLFAKIIDIEENPQ